MTLSAKAKNLFFFVTVALSPELNWQGKKLFITFTISPNVIICFMQLIMKLIAARWRNRARLDPFDRSLEFWVQRVEIFSVSDRPTLLPLRRFFRRRRCRRKRKRRPIQNDVKSSRRRDATKVRNKLERLSLESFSSFSLMFEGKAWSLPEWSAFHVFHSTVGSWPYSQTLN
jgi:hypothetical protein